MNAAARRIRITIPLTTALVACAPPAGDPLAEPTVRVVATPQEAQYLVAYLDVSAATLYIAQMSSLTMLLDRGFWPALRLRPEDLIALMVSNGDTTELRMEEGDQEDMAAREPAVGDTRFIDRGRRRVERPEERLDCFWLDGLVDADDPRTDREEVNDMSLSGPLPAAANGRRYVIVRSRFLGDLGDVIAPEVFLATARAYAYMDERCSAGFMGDYDVKREWVIETGLWPLP